MEDSKSISQIVQDIDFKMPNNPAGFILPVSIESSFKTAIQQSNKDFQHLLQISCNNSKDLGDQIFTQYEQSNLPLDEYIQRASLFHDSNIDTNITNIFKNYIIVHEEHIYKPLPKISSQLPHIFTPFNDNINIIMQYQNKMQKLIDTGVFNAPAVHLDVLFVPQHRRGEFNNIRIKGMVCSKPMTRMSTRSSLNEIGALFCGKQGKRIMNDCKQRLILMVIRGNENDTNNDILYLFTQKIKGNLKQKRYEYNQALWNINSKLDIKSINVQTKSFFIISYHLHGQQWKLYMQYNGYGQRIFKDNIRKQWYMLFRNGNICNSDKIIKTFKDYVETDKCIEYGKCLFGLRYYKTIYKNITNQRYILYVPKDVLKDYIPNIREHFVDQKQLYYYLMWTCKMQIIDNQFIHYIFSDNKQLGIFNCELHNKYCNNILYIVCAFHEINNNWTMTNIMTSYDIYRTYGINYKSDLPKGTRVIHDLFENEIIESKLSLKNEIIPIDYTKVNIFSGTKTSKSNVYDKNVINSIKESIDNNTPLIPILQVDLQNERIYCESLIPIKLVNEQSYICVSFRTVGSKIEITSFYTDCNDILNKATLVNPNAYDSYKYLNGNNNNMLIQQIDQLQAWRIESLQRELQAALRRENQLLVMLRQQNANMPSITPICSTMSSITPIICNMSPIVPLFRNNRSDSPSLPPNRTPNQPALNNNNSDLSSSTSTPH